MAIHLSGPLTASGAMLRGTQNDGASGHEAGGRKRLSDTMRATSERHSVVLGTHCVYPARASEHAKAA
jgi:hypothetical protein